MKLKKLGWTVFAAALVLGSLAQGSNAQELCADPICYDDCRMDGFNRAYCLKTCC